jgi:hypothetical protein
VEEKVGGAALRTQKEPVFKGVFVLKERGELENERNPE